MVTAVSLVAFGSVSLPPITSAFAATNTVPIAVRTDNELYTRMRFIKTLGLQTLAAQAGLLESKSANSLLARFLARLPFGNASGLAFFYSFCGLSRLWFFVLRLFGYARFGFSRFDDVSQR